MANDPCRLEVIKEKIITSASELACGSHLFKITGYSVLKEIDVGKYISSSTFSVGGHEFYIDLYPQGNEEKNEEFISLYLVLNSDEKDLLVQFDFGLVDMTGKSSILGEKTSQSCTFAFKNHYWGFGRFIKRADLEVSQYLRGDCFVVKCTVRVVKSTREQNIPQIDQNENPPSDLHVDFGELLKSGHMKDVTFEVEEEKFHAHRLVLSARSTVFKKLLGQINEEEMGFLRVKDMKPSSFKAFLHYIYTDELPNAAENINIIAELLEAGGQYEIERLKIICEEKLCANVSIDNVVYNFILAEKRDCKKLKSACLQFASKPENLITLMQTDDENKAGLTELLKKLSQPTL